MNCGGILYRDIEYARLQGFGDVHAEAVLKALELHHSNSALSNAFPSVVYVQ